MLRASLVSWARMGLGSAHMSHRQVGGGWLKPELGVWPVGGYPGMNQSGCGAKAQQR